VKPVTQLEQSAFNLYVPPFKFESGYIFDSAGNMVADEAAASALRVRGWGRISYLENSEELQDAAGKLIAKALTEFWMHGLADKPGEAR